MENPQEGLDSDLESGDGAIGRAPRPLIQAVQWLPARDVLPREADDFTPWLADNLDILAAARELAATRDWLHVIQLPAYAPDLNPTEGVWSHVKRSLGNLAVTSVDHLAAIVRNRLKRIQYRPTY